MFEAKADVKKKVDLMIDWRKVNRPSDDSDIRVNVERVDMHKGLHPELNYDRHVKSEDLPISCFYRGYRVVSIPGEKKAPLEKLERQAREKARADKERERSPRLQKT
jgi:hypothetical protein